MFSKFCFLIFFYPYFKVDSDDFMNAEYEICFKVDPRTLEILGFKVLKRESPWRIQQSGGLGPR